jgi:hypothetical protein
LTVSLNPGQTFADALNDTITYYGITVAQVSNLQVYGELDANDFTYIRTNMEATLQSLDMSETSISGNAIPDHAFDLCWRLTSVSMPNSVTTIGIWAFAATGLTSVSIPGSVTTIGDMAFAATALTDVTVYWATPLSNVAGNTFQGVNLASSTLHVPAGTKALYEAADVWKDFGTIVAPSLSVSPASLTFTAAGGSQNITLTTNVGWTATGSATWVSVSPASGSNSGTVSVTAAANTGDARTATITLTGGGITQTVSVSQAAASPASSLTLSSLSLTFSAAGSSQSISVTSNVGWTATGNAAWVTVSPASGSNNGAVSVTTAANTGDARTASVTLAGGGLTRTVDIRQAAAAAPPASSLTVSPTSLTFAATGSSQSIAVASNVSWTAAGSAAWVTVSPASGSNNGTVSVTAAANTAGDARTATITLTGDSITQTVSVTQGAAQQIVVEPSKPADNQGDIEVSLNIPIDDKFTVTFTVSLPAGFVLDPNATSLAVGLLSSFQLSITPLGNGGWQFTIKPKLSLLSATETSYLKVIQIVYKTEPSVANGNYEVKISDVNLSLNSGEVIHQDEIKVPVQVGNTTGNEGVEATDVFYANGILFVNTPSAERIDVYSVSGSLLYQAQKPAGEATFNLSHLPKGVYIVKGSSGWTEKIVK